MAARARDRRRVAGGEGAFQFPIQFLLLSPMFIDHGLTKVLAGGLVGRAHG
jgi:hypothetical protein